MRLSCGTIWQLDPTLQPQGGLLYAVIIYAIGAAGLLTSTEQECNSKVPGTLSNRAAQHGTILLCCTCDEVELACRQKPAVIANMSARVGSIGDNSLGGWYSYRASKTALNQLTKTMSLECARRKMNVACILLHPGTVDTDLSLPFQKVCHSMHFKVCMVA